MRFKVSETKFLDPSQGPSTMSALGNIPPTDRLIGSFEPVVVDYFSLFGFLPYVNFV